jgi:hypothetical protein
VIRGLGWQGNAFKAKHHFSFAEYHDPARMGWGALRVATVEAGVASILYELKAQEYELITRENPASTGQQCSVLDSRCCRPFRIPLVLTGSRSPSAAHHKITEFPGIRVEVSGNMLLGAREEVKPEELAEASAAITAAAGRLRFRLAALRAADLSARARRAPTSRAGSPQAPQ